MSSVRVPDDLRERLNEAAPEGTPLHEVIQRLLDEAGGPTTVRAALEEDSRRQEAKARVARLRRAGHASVNLEEGEQVALAEAAVRWCRALEDQGRRRFDPASRTLVYRPRSPDRSGSRVQPTGRFARAEDES